MMRLPRHAPNFLGNLPEPLFLLVLSFLGIMSYEEDQVSDWEIEMFSKKKIDCLN